MRKEPMQGESVESSDLSAFQARATYFRLGPYSNSSMEPGVVYRVA